MKIEHIGIAVRNLETSLKLYTSSFGGRIVHREDLPEEAVMLAFVNSGGLLLELLAPTTKDGPLARFLDSRGGGLHHLAFEVRDIHQSLRQAERSGHHPIDRQPRPGSRGTLVAFLHPSTIGGVLIELVQKPE